MSSRGAGGRPAGQPKPDIANQLVLLLAMVAAAWILFDNEIRTGLGKIVGLGLWPIVGLDAEFPLVTLVFTGMIMTIFSVTVRHFFMDWVGMARAQRIQSAFTKELREARTSNNTYKLRKLTEIQPEIMSQTFKTQQTQFKLMPVTMIVIIPIFAWLSTFVYNDLQATSFSVPWQLNSDMTNANVLPNWILLYSLVTIPVGQVLQRVLKYFAFTRLLRDAEARGKLGEPSEGESG